MNRDAGDVAARLAEHAEAVCREYLPQGRRSGRYWLVGDVQGNPGRSLFVRLAGPSSGPGAAGHWRDGATAQYGDLLDLIALNRGHTHLRDTLEEARLFLGDPARLSPGGRDHPPRDTMAAARRLFAASQRVTGSVAETYLHRRGITAAFDGLPSLRFHPACCYRADDHAPFERWPALVAAVTDLSRIVTGVQRTWLARDGSGKAPIADPRRAMGRLLGNGVRFGPPGDVLAAGEGIETMLSLKSLLPAMPMVAALSTAHLAALLLPPGLLRLYVAADNDAPGHRAAAQLARRARAAGTEAHLLMPLGDDWNTDLVRFGPAETRAALAAQLMADDVRRFGVPPLLPELALP
jgi:hypothetical protein